MKNKVLVAEICHSTLIDELEKEGYECHNLPDCSNEKVREIIGEYYGLVVRSRIKVDKELLDLGTNLKFVARVGSGMELIDMAYAKSIGIQCLNSPEGNRESVAEHALASMIVLLKNIVKSDREMRQGIWLRKDNRGRELGSQTVGIIGFGNTGNALARKLNGFDCRILAYDKYKTGFGSEKVEECELEDIFAECTVLSIHLPLTSETKYMLNSKFFNKFTNPFYLINTSRGEIVKTSDLVKSIETEKILGVALDVFEKEPMDCQTTNLTSEEKKWMDILKTAKNSILTPHTAGLTSDSYYKLAYVLSQKIAKSPQLSAESHN